MKALKTKRRFVLLCVLTVLLALIIWTAWGNTALMVNTISVSSDRIPAGFSGYRIAQVSDLHNAEFGAGNTKLLQTISENTPNIIVITGDLIDIEVVTLDSSTKDMAEIIKMLEPEREIATEDGYTGILKPDYTKITVEAAGV